MKYHGGCHCGDIRYEVDMDIKDLVSCNCSICMKKGTLLAFVPESAFKLQSGQDSLTDYQFGNKTLHHLFCKRCGVTSFARGDNPPEGEAMLAINVRCLDDVDLSQYKINEVDGRSL